MSKKYYLAIALVLVVGLALVSWFSMEEPLQAAKNYGSLPRLVGKSYDGQKVDTQALRGKVLIVDLWATWCPPCRAEMARVDTDVIERFAGRDFVFLPLSRGEARSDVASFREKNGYDFPMGLDSTKSVFGLYASNYIPRNFLIDREGKIAATSVGYDTAEFDELIRTIEKTLENQ